MNESEKDLVIRYALVQMAVKPDDKLGNFHKVYHLTHDLNWDETDFLVLPELFATGVSKNPRNFEEAGDGETFYFLSRLASDHGIYILGSYIEKSGLTPKNTAAVFGPDGKKIFSYSKNYLMSMTGESGSYTPGTEASVFELAGHKFAVAVCYDLRFPELFRGFQKQGAECVMVLANWPEVRIAHWDALLKARAIENQMAVVGVNCVGETSLGKHPGHSMIVDASGNVVAAAEDNKEMVLRGDADLLEVLELRESFPVLRDQKGLCPGRPH